MRIIEHPLFDKEFREILECGGILRIDLQGLLEPQACLCRLTGGVVYDAKVIQVLDIGWVQDQGTL
ncbi:MAG TPA: hypothetical protein PLB81_06050 [Deltaproteobacteria bacterium]|nr:hypothetical protein [Deltaproteobacteria bacterium]